MPPKQRGEEGPAPVQARQLHLFGDVPPEMWNRLGTKLIPKLRASKDLRVGVEFTLSVSPEASQSLVQEIRQILEDLGVAGKVRVDIK